MSPDQRTVSNFGLDSYHRVASIEHQTMSLDDKDTNICLQIRNLNVKNHNEYI